MFASPGPVGAAARGGMDTFSESKRVLGSRGIAKVSLIASMGAMRGLCYG